ncbi:MAG: tetratricopeptide repeat protein [Erysipelotrichaceae bacterium]|nr:tetratricopeptide repeat protein [Erysipelotrichaceae bacterium]
MSEPLRPEDYEEPNCVLCDPALGRKAPAERIPQQRISARLDELMGKKEYGEAEMMLKNWVNEAEAYNDRQGLFFVLNEMMGYYRKIGKKAEGYAAVERALGMLTELEYTDTVSGATALTNAGTVYTSFEDYASALPLFRRAKEIYEMHPEGNEYKLAGLYNNLATSLTATESYEEADALYEKALGLLEKVENSELEMAMIWLNRLDILLSKEGDGLDEKKADPCLEMAKKYLDSENLERNSYYAFMVDKCVGVYDYFGWFLYAQELRERIKEIDERA